MASIIKRDEGTPVPMGTEMNAQTAHMVVDGVQLAVLNNLPMYGWLPSLRVLVLAI